MDRNSSTIRTRTLAVINSPIDVVILTIAYKIIYGAIGYQVHWRRCPRIGDSRGKGRSVDKSYENVDWCKAVNDLLLHDV